MIIALWNLTGSLAAVLSTSLSVSVIVQFLVWMKWLWDFARWSYKVAKPLMIQIKSCQDHRSCVKMSYRILQGPLERYLLQQCIKVEQPCKNISLILNKLIERHIDGFIEDCSISSAFTLEILLSWIKPSLLCSIHVCQAGYVPWLMMPQLLNDAAAPQWCRGSSPVMLSFHIIFHAPHGMN